MPPTVMERLDFAIRTFVDGQSLSSDMGMCRLIAKQLSLLSAAAISWAYVALCDLLTVFLDMAFAPQPIASRKDAISALLLCGFDLDLPTFHRIAKDRLLSDHMLIWNPNESRALLFKCLSNASFLRFLSIEEAVRVLSALLDSCQRTYAAADVQSMAALSSTLNAVRDMIAREDRLVAAAPDRLTSFVGQLLFAMLGDSRVGMACTQTVLSL